MADAAVPDATLAWAQGDKIGTCKAVNAKDLKAELVPLVPLVTIVAVSRPAPSSPTASR